jgi:dTDP-glucose 4,6-dehydratase
MGGIVVTGGAGFIGSEFIRQICAEETYEKVYVVDKLTYAGDLSRISNELSRNKCELIEADVNQVHSYSGALRECQALVHFAAESHVDNSIKNGSPFIETNILGTFNLLETARSIGGIRTVIVSTDEVYGSLEVGEANESTKINTSSIYSASKASADLIALANITTHKQDILLTRSCNNYGQAQDSEKLIPVVIKKAINNLPIPIYGTGTNVREWIHVSDHVRAILKVMKLGTSGSIYNIGTGLRVSNLEIITRILEIMGESKELISFVEDRKGHDRRYAIDSTKIRNEIDWSPVVELDAGLKQTVEWYLNASR